MLEFFQDLAKLTPVQHLIEYRYFWLVYVLVNFAILFKISKNRRSKRDSI